MHRLTLFLLVLSAVVGSPRMLRAQSPAGVEFFEKKIRPVLVEHCYACHSAEADKAKKLKAGLRLDTREGVLKGGRNGPALVPGKAKGSLLIEALHYSDLRMPPKGKLPDVVIADFETWVGMGAPDPRDGKSVSQVASIDWNQARQAWAFQKPIKHAPPRVKDATWPRKEADFFLLAELEKRGLAPVSPATRHALIRRATFDLIGLPPTPQEVDAFLNDSSADAFAKVVDRLLASPHYGERWGRYWLDLARYTDDLGGTVGPVLVPNAFRYRDWVVQAFHRDMPYDQFIRLQLAGDLMAEPVEDPFERYAGLGFQGLGQQFSGNAVGMVKKKVADELDDRIDTVTRSLLGLTVSCARCHDHKFDPIPTVDYYSLTASYNGAAWNSERVLETPQDAAAREQWKRDVADRKARTTQITLVEGRRLGRAESARIDAYLLAAWKLHVLELQKLPRDQAETARRDGLNPLFLARWQKAMVSPKPLPWMTEWRSAADAAARSAVARNGTVEAPRELVEQAGRLKAKIAEALRELDRVDEAAAKKTKTPPLSAEHQAIAKILLQDDGAPLKLVGNEILPFLSEALRKQHDELQTDLARLIKMPPPEERKAPAVSGGGKAMQINVRGNPDQLGAIAPPGFLQILQPAIAAKSGEFTRLDLANAIASRDNPLTARVFVNRVWHYHFGRGIVATLGNFGQLGDRPTHPELLDTLAVRFMESGWSIKWLHREIMLSAAYQLGASANPANTAKDPDNQFLWRMTSRRLDFEAWRDAMLAVSGRLDPRVGGPSFFPKGTGRDGQLHPEDPANPRRTLYGFISRFKPNPTLTLFDFPEPNVTSDRRNVTTIPQQQLFALNSPFTLAMARAFAARIEKEQRNDDDRIRLAWRLAYGREPTETERVLGREFLRVPAATTAERLSLWEQLCLSLLASNEFAFVN